MSADLTASVPVFATSPDRVKQARRGLLVYFALLIPISTVWYVVMSTTRSGVWTLALMCTPAVSSIFARLALREGIADVSFRLGGRRGLRVLLLALLLPITVAFLAYGTGWLTGLTPFKTPALPLFQQLVPAQASPALVLLLSLLIVTITTPLASFSALGEELGWRGYMLTRLIDAGLTKPILLSGLIWGFWHVPVIVIGLYVAGPFPVVTVALFMLSATAAAYVIGWLRLSSGSIWPCVLFHAFWNQIIQGTFDRSVTGLMSPLWVGEAGILVCLALVIIVFVLSRRRWTVIRQLPRYGEPAHEEVLPPALVY